MLDIRFVRENPELVAEKSKQKGFQVDITQLLGFDKKRQELLKQVEELRHQRNELAEAGKNQPPTQEDINRGRQLKLRIADMEHQLSAVDKELNVLLRQVPNMPSEDVPVGTSENQNQVGKVWGEKPEFDFEQKTHWEIAESRDLIDKERAAKVTGSRYAYIKGGLVNLQFAILNFVFNSLTDRETIKKIIQENGLENVSDKPFTPVLPPSLVNTEAYEATARLDAKETTYKVADEDLWLNASAEHSLCSMYKDEILNEAEFPIRYIGYATSFRREAGSYGKDIEGIIRMHQFDKAEMESFTVAEDGLAEHKLLIAIQEYLMQQLKLPYHVLNKCTADIGKANARGVDLEVWLPGQNRYLETHTADYMTDYQARGLQTRVKRKNGETELVHTNDATAFAMGRVLVAIMENYQQSDGTIFVPDALNPYMHGQTSI